MDNPKNYLENGPLSEEFKRYDHEIEIVGNVIVSRLDDARWDRSVEDANYLKAVILDFEAGCELRFSQFGRLTTVTNEDRLDGGTIEYIRGELLRHDFIYISETEMGLPLRERKLFNYDWFHRFFDCE